MRYFFIAILLCLGACAGTPQTRATDALAIACDSYATVLDQLTPLRAQGRMSSTAITRVDQANAKVKTVCGSGSVVDPASAVSMVQNAITLLRSVRDSM